MHRLLRRRSRSGRAGLQLGQALVEFALILPVLIIVLIGVVEVGDTVNSYISVVAASRDGARLGERGAVADARVRAAALICDLAV